MKFALVPLAVSLAAASPVWNNVAKRQASSALSEASSAIASATSAIESATSAASSAASSAVAVPSSAASSAMSSMMMSSSMMSAMPSASAVPAYQLAYPCPAGTELVYVQQQQTYPGVTVMQAMNQLVWSNETWYGVVNATGEEIGATRNVMFPGVPVTIGEVLVNSTVDPATGAVQQVFNGTTPLNMTGIVLASYSTVFQFYNNETETGSATGKLFTNACVSPASVQTTLGSLFQAALAALGTSVAAGAASSSASGAVSSAASSAVASSAAAGVASGVSSSAAAVASSVTGAASSLAASASQLVASAVPSV